MEKESRGSEIKLDVMVNELQKKKKDQHPRMGFND